MPRPRKPLSWFVDWKSPLAWPETERTTSVWEAAETVAWRQQRAWGRVTSRIRTGAFMLLVWPGVLSLALRVLHVQVPALAYVCLGLQACGLVLYWAARPGHDAHLGLGWKDAITNAALRIDPASIPAHVVPSFAGLREPGSLVEIFSERYDDWLAELALTPQEASTYADLLGEWHGTTGELAAAVRVL